MVDENTGTTETFPIGDDPEPCGHCGHEFGPHVLTWDGGDLKGETFCPVAGCDCKGTWSAKDII